MTVGVLRDGKQEVFGYGRMSRDDRRVPDGNTIYELASATKGHDRNFDGRCGGSRAG